MVARLGSALVLLGLIALTVFAVTLPAGQGDPRTLLLGAVLAALGLILRRRPRPSEEDQPGRFSTLRKILGRRPPDTDDS
jgi:peptidoglycan/LPS O-acetylase OafA/YrhL